MKKWQIWMVIGLFIAALSGCSCAGDRADGDTVTVYDAGNHKLFTLTDEAEVAEVVAILDNTFDYDHPEAVASTGKFMRLPDDAEVAYHYVCKRVRDGRVIGMDFFVYRNYPYITADNLPTVITLTWVLAPDTYDQLTHPERFAHDGDAGTTPPVEQTCAGASDLAVSAQGRP